MYQPDVAAKRTSTQYMEKPADCKHLMSSCTKKQPLGPLQPLFRKRCAAKPLKKQTLCYLQLNNEFKASTMMWLKREIAVNCYVIS